MAIRLLDLELTRPIEPIYPERRYDGVWLLIRFRGEPVGSHMIDNRQLPLNSYRLLEIIKEQHAWTVYTMGLRLLLGAAEGLHGISRHSFGQVFDYESPCQNLAISANGRPPPPVSVLVVRSHQNGQLEPCLDALQGQAYPEFELILVDEGDDLPAEQARPISETYGVQIVRGPSAFAQAIKVANHDILAVTGTAAIVNRGWLVGIARAFDHNPGVVACSGPHLPLELETAGQLTAMKISPHPDRLTRFYCYQRIFHYTPDQFGSWLNAAFRKDFLIGHLDELDAKSEHPFLLPLYYRALALGKIAAYEPAAFIRERYARDEPVAIKQAEAEIAAQDRFMLQALKKYPQEQRYIQRWLNRNKVRSIKQMKPYRYASKVKKMLLNLKREIVAAREIDL